MRHSINAIAIIAFSLWYTASLSQETAKLPTEPVTCDSQNVRTRVVSVRKVGAGEITLDVEYENLANFPVRLNASNGVSLFDDTGAKWDGSGNALSRNGEVPPGIRFRQSYRFTKLAGGEDAKAVSFVHQFRVWGKKGLHGTCRFDAKNLPLGAAG